MPASFLGDQPLENGEFLLIIQTLLFQSCQLMRAISGHRGVAEDVDQPLQSVARLGQRGLCFRVGSFIQLYPDILLPPAS